MVYLAWRTLPSGGIGLKYFVFLKGVNVGSTTKVDMKAVQAALEAKGIEAATFLNSGNVMVDGIRSAGDAEKAVREAVLEVSGLEVAAIVRTPSQVKASLAESPFSGRSYDQSHALIYFGERRFDVDNAKSLGQIKGSVEEYQCEKDALHVHYPDGIGRSKFTTSWIDKAFGLKTTGRNLETLRRMMERFG